MKITQSRDRAENQCLTPDEARALAELDTGADPVSAQSPGHHDGRGNPHPDDVNREKKKAYDRAYQAANRENIKARLRAHRAANREKINAALRDWQAANPTPQPHADDVKLAEAMSHCVTEQGKTGIFWTVFEGTPFSSPRVCSFAKREDVLEYLKLRLSNEALRERVMGLETQITYDNECIERVRKHGMELELQIDRLKAILLESERFIF